MNWHKSSWRNLPIKQQPKYENQKKLSEVEEKLNQYPALIYFDEAIKFIKNAVCSSPDRLVYYVSLIDAHIRFNDFQSAYLTVNEAELRFPDSEKLSY